MVAVSVPHQWRLQDFAATHFADAKRQASEVSLVRASLDSAAEQQEACEALVDVCQLGRDAPFFWEMRNF